MKETNKKKKFQLFDLGRDGKGISKKAPLKESGLKRFFLTYKNNFGKLIYVNMYMVLGNFPLIFLIAVLSGYSKISAYLPLSDLFQNLCGTFMIEPTTPFQMSLYALEGLQDHVLIDTTISYVLYGLGALTLFTFGVVNVGTAYILRNIAKGEPIFIWADFWYAIKRNWKQALPFGIIDGLASALLLFNLYTTAVSVGNFLTSMMFWGTVVLMVLYYFMRPYVYIQMVTFDLSVFKMLKNSLIFALLGFKRNFMSLLGTLICVALEIMFFFALGSLLVPLGVAAPLAILFSTMAYMKVYAAYFKIKEIMIDPYLAEHPELLEGHDDVEVIMRDDVTERERLEEIKKRNNITN